MEKRIYEEPQITVIYLPDEDVLTFSTPDHNLNNAFNETDSADI